MTTHSDPMTTYHTIDGATFTAADPTDLLTQLRNASFNPEADLPSYCRATAKACKMQTGRKHRAWPPQALVDDMMLSGLLSIETPNPKWKEQA